MLDLNNPDSEQEEAEVAMQIADEYPPYVVALAMAKMLRQRLVHPELMKINLELCKSESPVQGFYVIKEKPQNPIDDQN